MPDQRRQSGKGRSSKKPAARPASRPDNRPDSRRRPGGRRPQPAQAEPLPVIEVTIDALATGGEGLGRGADGRVVFVPRSAPGDKLRVALTESKAKYARGVIQEVIEPAPERIEPACHLFASGKCGGCQWQHLNKEHQSRAKAAIVARELRKAIGRGMTMMPMVAEVPGFKWRRRARLHYARPHGAKAALLGFYAGRGRRIADVESCPQLAPALADTVAILREHLTPHLGSRGSIDILAGHDGHVHVAISGYCSPRWASKLVGKAGVHGTIMGVALYPPRGDDSGRASSRPDRGAGSLASNEWGKRSIPLELGFKGRADLFAQASAAGNEALKATVQRACGPLADQRVLELFAGAGNFTRALASEAGEVVAVDSRPVPWHRELVVGDAAAVVANLIDDGQYFDLVVLDPPRTGAAEVMPGLLELHPERIVYVSCDPATLARDIETLAAGGYRAEFAQPLDLMPQTSHVEVVVALSSTDEL